MKYRDMMPPPGATMIVAEGARVGFVTCPKCACAILVDPRDTVDAYEKHLAWHDENDAEPLIKEDAE